MKRSRNDCVLTNARWRGCVLKRPERLRQWPRGRVKPMNATAPTPTQFPHGPSVADYLEHRTPLHLERILVPVDFSEESSKALKYALGFARVFGAEIVVLYVKRRMQMRNGTTLDWLGSNLRLFAERELGRRCKWQSAVQIGKPHEEIASIAKERHVDLIIMSSHQHRGGLRCLNASSRVSACAPCPILLLREPEHEFVCVQRRHSQTFGS